LVGPNIWGVRSKRKNERAIGRKLYQGIQADGATDDAPNPAEGESDEPLFLEGSGGHVEREK
jgi:hypothetical protein